MIKCAVICSTKHWQHTSSHRTHLSTCLTVPHG